MSYVCKSTGLPLVHRYDAQPNPPGRQLRRRRGRLARHDRHAHRHDAQRQDFAPYPSGCAAAFPPSSLSATRYITETTPHITTLKPYMCSISNMHAYALHFRITSNMGIPPSCEIL